jgi:CRP-like cAMP-binding protein
MLDRDEYLQLSQWETINFLRSVPLFQKWSRVRLQNFASHLIPQVYSPGTIITNQGDKCNGLYFIKQGNVMTQKRLHLVKANEWPVRVTKAEVDQSFDGGEEAEVHNSRDKGGSSKVLSHYKRRLELHLDRYMDLDKMQPGEYLGADAILSNDHRLKVSARAIGYVHVLLLTRQDLMEKEKLFCKQLVHAQTHSAQGKEAFQNVSEQRIVEKMRSLELAHRKQLHVVLAKGHTTQRSNSRDQVFTDWDWANNPSHRFRDLIIEPSKSVSVLSATRAKSPLQTYRNRSRRRPITKSSTTTTSVDENNSLPIRRLKNKMPPMISYSYPEL